MATILLMGIAGGDWLPILGIMVTPMATYLGIEWLVNYTENYFTRHHKAHK